MQITFISKWLSSKIAIIFLITISLFTTSCKNLFTELADQDADAALFYEARMYANEKDYVTAIDIIENEMGAEYQAKRKVQVFLASMYAGKCGMEYLYLAKAMLSSSGATSPLDVALTHMKGSTTETDCKTAEAILRAQSPTGNGVMSDDTNDAFLMAFVALAKIGAILERYGDTGSGNPDNDGVVDAGFDACNTGTIADADAREIGTGLTLVYNNVLASGKTIANKMSALTALCTAIGGTTCTITNPATFTANEVKSLMGVVNYQTFGVGSDVAYTPCP